MHRLNDKIYVTYILASRPRGVLYTGITGDLSYRVFQHKHKVNQSFTMQYSVKRLVYYEMFYDPGEAIAREKHIKKWNREWKIKIIEKHNPEWKDLYENGEILPLPVQ